ncbi:hypothetical protein CcaverHIS002_0501100 [Cutaneotrichosporon cavernicola]|uniref:GIT Spa2 homology (SHD) domain-containing protein n=1 Tax=Cutaneotrichosporon cavernicola TaxID=279322 RepID=A0AA48L7R4_9TREE|nr:uncharacterized protein CcaverHIS019_0601100 [Cutaneotrichosporon cavernicola]BEI84709.1 hypothetical protein CcaverHIS002_0501100 [Cutaneotrichosporon cavernicola]BEI93651.1 hypothetical protein CcaverHIS019_0601100 [Cutaneotrichosporon cavernicola]BEJ01428.1 hypothetical protein CcaverHIS631_0601100 [Cutaneotrichosporon cavernicola]BEJ09195.1 hypothetical protein CcaverHIS641_0601100 [Cutaneotrichosporon cavernicola]
MATRFGPGAQQFPSPQNGNMRPGYMRLGSTNSATSPSPNGAPYSHQQRQPSGGPSAAPIRKADRKDAKEVAWVHWRALKDFLTAFGDKESPTARASAREKLTRLTRLQFLELSTDVYDELMRRLAEESNNQDGAVAPFLPVRDDFHPKRNQARQKLATLPKNRFKDLSSDVFFELRRRYPEFEAEATKSVEGEQEMLHEETLPSAYAGAGGGVPPSSSSSSLASQTRAQQRPAHHRKGSSMGSNSSIDRERNNASVNSQARDRYANLTTPTNDVVVPNKSRLQEEAIEVPYARDSHHEDAQPLLPQSGAGTNGMRSESPSPTSASHDPMSPGATDEQYLDRMSFSSNMTGARKGSIGGLTSPNGWEDQEHKLRAEYELRIAGLERKLQAVEGERDDMQRELADQRERRKDYEDEVRGLKERSAGHAATLRSMQDELDVSRDETATVRMEYDQKLRQAQDGLRQSQDGLRQSQDGLRQAQEEIAQWRLRCDGFQDELHRLETERADRATREVSPAANGESVAELRNEMRSLVDELQSLSMQNDELMSERERGNENQSALEAQVEEYRKQANAARTELRNLKATSTMFVSQPLSNDHLPASPDGNIADAHVSAFQIGIDSLLAAARSSAPSGVLPSMKAVVEAVTSIGDDVKVFEESPNLDVDVSRLELLKYESSTRLSALMSAARNHAMASGLSPVSLIDAAAGYLSANVVEIIKLLKIRRTGSTREILSKQSMSISDMVRRKSGVYASIDEAEEDAAIARGSVSPPTQYAAPTERRPSGPGMNMSPPRGYGLSPIPGSPSSRLGTGPPSAFEAPELRVKSFQSASSVSKHSGSFDLERKVSVASRGSDYGDRDPFASASTPTPTPGLRLNSAAGTAPTSIPVPAVTIASSSPENVRGQLEQSTSPAYQNQPANNPRDSTAHRSTNSYDSNPRANEPYTNHRSNTSHDGPQYASNNPFAQAFGAQNPTFGHQRQYSENHSAYSDTSAGPDAEWDQLKPYLNTQSSALVNHIQNLLAAIRTGGQGPALNEHLSEVIAVSSSIVGVCRASLPPRLQAPGEPLLADLVGNTDRLSEAQQAAARAGGFDKALRQGIASASFGVAKALKAFMKVGGTAE